MFSIQKATRYAWQSGYETLRDWLLPQRCAGCARVDQLLCDVCQHTITTRLRFYGNPIFDEIDQFTAVGFHSGELRSAIHQLKYENRPELQYPLGRMLAARLLQEKWIFDLFIPVPLHFSRYNERMYNQATILAMVAAEAMESLTLPQVLHRTRATTPQVGKNATERQQNVQDAFVVQPEHHYLIKGKTIVLVDDVCTTGSTLTACAVALRKAGADKILAVTLSRAYQTGIHTDSK